MVQGASLENWRPRKGVRGFESHRFRSYKPGDQVKRLSARERVERRGKRIMLTVVLLVAIIVALWP